MSRKLREKTDRLLSKEKGTIYKSPGGKITVCLAYPNTYHVGMSSLGFQGVYGLLNQREDVVCERAFLPNLEDLTEFERTDEELFSLESKTPLGRFDILAFSVSFENDYPNILRILELSRIPLEARQRSRDHPLLMLGGVCASSNPEPLAEFFDLCFVGEAEEMLDDFFDAFGTSGSRDEVFAKAVGIEGIYVPKYYEEQYGEDKLISGRIAYDGAPEKVRRRCITDISKCGVRHVITTPETEFADMCLVEAMRGCPWSCRFCLAGSIYNPSRRKALDDIRKEIEKGREQTGRVGLIGPSLSDYPYKEEVLCIDGVDFSVTSLRASSKSAELVKLLEGHKSVSIAPEAGTQRLRDYISKKITEDDVIETSRLLFESGIQRLRLYFMVGLPGETDEDVVGIVDLIHKVRETSDKGAVTVTLSTFVPKPFTAFERMPMQDIKVVKERLKTIKRALKQTRGVSVFHDVPKYAYLQGMLSMGDRRVSRALVAMLGQPDWRKASEEAGIDPDFYTLRTKSEDEQLPWDFIA